MLSPGETLAFTGLYPVTNKTTILHIGLQVEMKLSFIDRIVIRKKEDWRQTPSCFADLDLFLTPNRLISIKPYNLVQSTRMFTCLRRLTVSSRFMDPWGGVDFRRPQFGASRAWISASPRPHTSGACRPLASARKSSCRASRLPGRACNVGELQNCAGRPTQKALLSAFYVCVFNPCSPCNL
jgi:hypothetical protein